FLAFVAFTIRPFGVIVIAGCVGAMLIYDSRPPGEGRLNGVRLIWILTPFAFGLAACILLWIRLAVLGPTPWNLHQQESHLAYLIDAPLANYLRAGVLGPALYLGTVLAPMALLQLGSRHWRRVIAGGFIIFLFALALLRLDQGYPVTPEYSC